MLFNVNCVSPGNILTVLASEGLYVMLCELQCNVLWAVCSVCQGKGSITQKVQELETRVLFMDHQQQINKLLLEERQ